MDKRWVISRGDLIRCFDRESGIDAAFIAKAGLCGYGLEPERLEILPHDGKAADGSGGDETRTRQRRKGDESVEETRARGREKARFWLAATLEVEDKEAVDKRHEMPEKYRGSMSFRPGDFGWSGEPERGQPLQPWSKLWPFLRQVLSKSRPSRQPDVKRITANLVRGKSRSGRFPGVSAAAGIRRQGSF
jgi:hypothetical protein